MNLRAAYYFRKCHMYVWSINYHWAILWYRKTSYAFIHVVVSCSVLHLFADIGNETNLGGAFVAMPIELTLTHDQQDRLSRIRAVCREMNKNSHIQLEKLQHIWVDLRNKMLVCAPPNVGSNTLKHILLSTSEDSLNLRNSSERIHESLLRKRGITSLDTFRPVQANHMLHNFRKIMFVRHPLERLASVYNSKFDTINYQYEEFQKHFRRTIIRKFRLNATTEVRRNGRNVTFQELVNFVINLWENGDELDIYLTPISDICFPCGISYDFVGYLENFVDDTQSVFASLSNTYQRIMKRFLTHRRRYNEATIRDVYRLIPKTDIFKLSEVYNIDFYMHAYNLDDVVHWWWRCFCLPIASMAPAKKTIHVSTTIFTRGALYCLLVPEM